MSTYTGRLLLASGVAALLKLLSLHICTQPLLLLDLVYGVHGRREQSVQPR